MNVLGRDHFISPLQVNMMLFVTEKLAHHRPSLVSGNWMLHLSSDNGADTNPSFVPSILGLGLLFHVLGVAVADLFDFVLHPSSHALTDVVVLRESRVDAVELLIPCDGILHTYTLVSVIAGGIIVTNGNSDSADAWPVGCCRTFRRTLSEPCETDSDVEALLTTEEPATWCHDCPCREPELLLFCCDCDMIVCQLCREEEHTAHYVDDAANASQSARCLARVLFQPTETIQLFMERRGVAAASDRMTVQRQLIALACD